MKKVFKGLTFTGFAFIEPFISLIKGKEVRKNGMVILKSAGLPIISIILFLVVAKLGSGTLYNIEAERRIEKARETGGEEAAITERECIESGDKSCQPNVLPSPNKVWIAAVTLWDDIFEVKGKKEAFNKRVKKTNEQRKAKGLKPIEYTGRPSFADQVFTSLKTVLWGVLLAIFIAVPFGILLGLSKDMRNSTNWVIQIFKPVSPVVWLLLVSMVIKTVMAESDKDLAFTISFISVAFCAMWPTLVNTALGVSTVDADIMNVVRVLKLGYIKQIYKVILPSAIPLIFTGIRITVSVAWMVLIAIELLAQSPGLGSFVWEEFQNGANDSNAKIIVAMFVIGIIGFLLDRLMFMFQKLFTINA